ncbi:MAG: hypothetical protein L0H59_10780 [Tomitella sp.]|nr:hypothetical protein [Tomitella sp.]
MSKRDDVINELKYIHKGLQLPQLLATDEVRQQGSSAANTCADAAHQ